MHALSFFRFGVPQEAPSLTITSGSSDNTPDFLLNGDLAEADTVRFSYSTDSGFSGASEITNTIDAAEDAANELNFSTGALASGTWYFRARIERPPGGVTAWSNTETITIDANGGPIGLFGRWFGGFGGVPAAADGGYISLFGRHFGGFGSSGAIVVEPTEPPPTGGWWPEPRYEPPKPGKTPGKKKRAKRREEPEFTDPTAGLVPLSDAIVIEETAISASDASALRRAQARLNAAAAAEEKEEEEAILIALSLH